MSSLTSHIITLTICIVIPLCHLYVPEDEVTCQRFDFPLILSGHDHHVVDSLINKTRLLKAGADAEHAIVIDLVWESHETKDPAITYEIIKVKTYEPDVKLQERVTRAYSILDPLKHTQLCQIPREFRPLSSKGSRDRLCSVGRFLWSSLKKSLNSEMADKQTVDAILLNGGDIRGSKEYRDDEYFSLESLKSEIQEQLTAVVVKMSGKMIKEGVYISHRNSNPGFIQIDDGVKIDESGYLCEINNEPLDEDKTYRIATTRWDLLDGPCKPWTTHFNQNIDSIPLDGYPVYTTLVSYFAETLWANIFRKIDTDNDGTIDENEFKRVDTNGDGALNREEIAAIMKSLGFDIDMNELGFIDCIMEIAGDINHENNLTREKLNSSSRKRNHNSF